MSNLSFDVASRTVTATGAARGIGIGPARTFHSNGAIR
jgi:NAD(P)-dependent dehydrogenase (short-subunit alcohol dehydrogenase family)